MNGDGIKIKTCLYGLLLMAQHLCFCQQGSATFINAGTFTVPSGVTQVTIEVLASGGQGGLYGGGGGGGGGFAKGVYSVIPGSILSIKTYYDTCSVKPFLYATRGEDGKHAFDVNNPSKGGKGGIGWGGNLINSYGGDGGSGTPYYYGGGGGGAAGISGNGFNGANAPASIPSASWTGSPGGAGGGGLAGSGGRGAVLNYFNNAIHATTYGAGGGGGYSSGGVGSSAHGYCHISWGNCYTPPSPYSFYYTSTCSNASATLTARGYDTLTWVADTVTNHVLAKGPVALKQFQKDTFVFVRSIGTCGAMSKGLRVNVYVQKITPVVATAQPTRVCFGSNFTLSATNSSYFTWSTGNYYSTTIGTNTLTSPGQKTVSFSVIGEWYDNECKSFDTVSVVMLEKPEFHWIASKTDCCRGDTINVSGWGPALSKCQWNHTTPGFTTSIIVGSHPGYWAAVTDTNGCHQIYPIPVNVLTPEITAFSSPPVSCRGEAVELLALGAATFTWQTGQAGNLITEYPEQSATYTVIGTSSGCTSSATVEHIVNDCTALREVKSETMKIFPNPSEGSFVIQNVAGLLNIRDIHGKTVFETEVKNVQYKINPELPSGVYFISSGRSIQKLIVLSHN
jgi:hypothetical protein